MFLCAIVFGLVGIANALLILDNGVVRNTDADPDQYWYVDLSAFENKSLATQLSDISNIGMISARLNHFNLSDVLSLSALRIS